MPDTILRASGMMPSLTVDDVQHSLAFFEGLGFAIEDRWENDGKLLGVMLRSGDVRIGLSQDDGKKGTSREKGVGIRLYIESNGDIDDIAARAKAAGVTLAAEPHQTEWGTRAFNVVEPSGFTLTISSPSK